MLFCCLSGKIAKLQNPVFLETKGMECWQSGCNASIMKMSFPLVNKWAKIIDNDDKEFCEDCQDCASEFWKTVMLMLMKDKEFKCLECCSHSTLWTSVLVTVHRAPILVTVHTEVHFTNVVQ